MALVLDPGSRLGPYEILAPLGGDGLGEVFEARDARTDQAVLLKVLAPGRDPGAVDRCEAEARAAAELRHPAILGALDFARHGDIPYIVTEDPAGETLADRLEQGALPAAEAAALGARVARGLAAAHGRGLAHGGLAPSRIWIGPDGDARILDFGLASTAPPAEDPFEAAFQGPEGIPGAPPAPEGDIYSLGAVLLAALTGEGVPDRAGLSAAPPAFRGILARCLDPAPGERFQDAGDLALMLESLAPSLEAPALLAPFARANRRATLLGSALGLGLALAAGFAGWRLHAQPLARARLRMLNFPTGTIDSARFAADGKRVFFSLRTGGKAPEIYVCDPDSAEPSALGIHDAHLLAVSARDELAVLQGPAFLQENQYLGTLAVAKGAGGTLRKVRGGTVEAVWDGQGLATLTEEGVRFTLEFPPGKAIDSWAEADRTVNHLRLSPDGALLACVDSEDANAVTRIKVYTREGGYRTLCTREGDGSGGRITGLAWGPGKEIWVSEAAGDQSILWALSLGGARRVLWRSQGDLQLLDVSRAGLALLAQQTSRWYVCGLQAGGKDPVDLSIQGRTQLKGISEDGSKVVLDESPLTDGGSVLDRCYLRPVSGGPPRALGKGFANAITADGAWVNVDPGPLPVGELPGSWARALGGAGLADRDPAEEDDASRLLLFVPAGEGTPFTLAIPRPFEPNHGIAYLLKDGRGAVVNVNIGDRPGWVRLDRRGGPPSVLTPRDRDWPSLAGLAPLSPDGTRMIVREIGEPWYVLPLAGGPLEPIRGLRPGERVVGWGADGASVFVRSGLYDLPVNVARMDLRTGERAPAFSFSPLDPSGFLDSRDVFITQDGRRCAVSYRKKLSDLYVAQGFGKAAPPSGVGPGPGPLLPAALVSLAGGAVLLSGPVRRRMDGRRRGA